MGNQIQSGLFSAGRLLAPCIVGGTLLVGCGSKPKPTPPPPVPASTEPVESTVPMATEEVPTSDSANLQDVVYFAFDSSDLDDAARAGLENNAKWMKEDPTRVLTIEGHTDEVGTTDYNLALGERRARATKEYLVRLGVDEKRIQIITYGEERPAAGDDALNRRSMFVATRK